MIDASSPITAPDMAPGPHLITAVFGSSSDAEAAVKDLIDAGIPKDAVRLMPGYERDAPEGVPGQAIDPARSTGFLNALGELFTSDDERGLYAGYLGRGGFLVTVHASQADHDRIVDILDREGRIETHEPDVG